SNTSLAQQWKACKAGQSIGVPKVLGITVPEDTVYVEPPGIALDAPWLAAIAVQVRDLDPATIEGEDAVEKGEHLFEKAYDRARQHSTQWLRDLTIIMESTDHGDFWRRVRT